MTGRLALSEALMRVADRCIQAMGGTGAAGGQALRIENAGTIGVRERADAVSKPAEMAWAAAQECR